MAVSPKKLQELAVRMQQLGLREAELEEHFTRGSGKGGQKVNKTNNCVCLSHPASGIVVRCHREREREVNRYLARRALCDALEYHFHGGISTQLQERIRAARRGDERSRASAQIIYRKTFSSGRKSEN